MIIDFEAAAPTQPNTISSGDIGAESISYIVPENLGKYIPNAPLFRLDVIIFNIINPGTIKAPYDTPSISVILDPIADPKTTK